MYFKVIPWIRPNFKRKQKRRNVEIAQIDILIMNLIFDKMDTFYEDVYTFTEIASEYLRS